MLGQLNQFEKLDQQGLSGADLLDLLHAAAQHQLRHLSHRADGDLARPEEARLWQALVMLRPEEKRARNDRHSRGANRD